MTFESPRAGSRPTAALAPKVELLLGQLTGRRGPAPGLVADRRSANRRTDSTWSILYGGMRPRRRVSRRSSDRHRVVLDWHEPQVLYVALAILIMSCLDALFTLNLLAVGGEEMNGIMEMVLGRSVRWFLLAKIGLTALSIVTLVISARRLLLGRVPVLWVLRLFCAGYSALIVWEVYLLGWHATTLGDSAFGAFLRWAAR